MIGNVVAMLTAGPRSEIRRQIEVADPKRSEIGHYSRHVVEGEIVRELKPVGRTGNRCRYSCLAIRHGQGCSAWLIASPLVQRPRQRQQAFADEYRVQVDGQPPPPVRVLPVGSGNIDLLDL